MVDKESNKILMDLVLPGMIERLNHATALYSKIAGPPPTEAQLAQWKREREEREAKEQEEANQKFLGTVVAVKDTMESLTLTYSDGRVVRVDKYSGDWDDY